MKVNVPNTHDLVPVRKLAQGAVFSYGNVYYMKMKLISDSNWRHYTAVSIVSGIPCCFSDDASVNPVDGEFVVKKEDAL